MSQQETVPFAIRVLSEKTGVNSVTLRAWERRYGLLKPIRTPKGHRLYTEQDVERVNRILAWINRGIAVGKIKPLLDADEGAELPQVEDMWQEAQQLMLEAAKTRNANKLSHWLAEYSKQYPLALYIDKGLWPFFETLYNAAELTQEYLFAQAVLLPLLNARLASFPLSSRPDAVVMSHSDTPMWQGLLMACSVASKGRCVQFLPQLDAPEKACDYVRQLAPAESFYLSQHQVWEPWQQLHVLGTHLCGTHFWLSCPEQGVVAQPLTAIR